MKINSVLQLCEIYLKKTASYWGKSAAGILFICSEDGTMLLAKRSQFVLQPGTWGIPGGAVRLESEDDPEESNLNGAKREVKEELGSLPSDMSLITSTEYKDGDFTYTTFVFDIPLEEKERWTPSISLNWENTKASWFDRDSLPSPLHFGIRSLSNLLSNQDFELFTVNEDEENEEYDQDEDDY